MTLPCYRRDYSGEFLVTETRWAGGTKQQSREWIPNPIENHHISGRAAVIVSDVDRAIFDYARLQRHRGGLLGKKRLQTYATGRIWQDMILDFWVGKERSEIDSIIAQQYDERCTVYTTPRIVLTYPGRLYLIPMAPRMDSQSTALYLAAFDGHREIFLLGANLNAPWLTDHTVADIGKVMAAYDTIQFILVGIESRMPAEWRQLRNVACQDYRTWISYCDI
jgi:hypothetical protein